MCARGIPHPYVLVLSSIPTIFRLYLCSNFAWSLPESVWGGGKKPNKPTNQPKTALFLHIHFLSLEVFTDLAGIPMQNPFIFVLITYIIFTMTAWRRKPIPCTIPQRSVRFSLQCSSTLQIYRREKPPHTFRGLLSSYILTLGPDNAYLEELEKDMHAKSIVADKHQRQPTC